jgi:spore maturation protein CgeB
MNSSRGNKMRILFFDWKSYGKEHLVKGLIDLGFEVERILFDHEKDDNKIYEDKAKELLSYQYYDLVFSSNYFPTIANACHENGIIYISWLYDSPYARVWDTTAYYPECYIFSFDQKLCDGLKKEGIQNVYYMPLAVEVDILDEIQATDSQKEQFEGDVAFVGSLYDNKNTFAKLIKKNKLEFHKGYLDAVIEAQTKIHGVNFLEEILEPKDISDMVDKLVVKLHGHGALASKNMIYANYYLGQAVTLKERSNMIKRISQKYKLNVYTHSNISKFKKVINKGSVDYYKEMPLVFRLSKINLNMTLRSIQTGIPLRAWDIMGSGGFLLTNYQADFLKHFEPGVDFDYFLDEDDMMRKIGYYLEHEEERQQIAKSGYEKVKKYHSYKIRLKEMFQIVEEMEQRGWI